MLLQYRLYHAKSHAMFWKVLQIEGERIKEENT